MSDVLLAVTGVVLGAGGLLCGLLALQRTRTVADDYRAVLRQSLSEIGGGVDPCAIRDVAVVRYGAFGEGPSEARSFSLAMLSAAGNGVVLTSVNGRREARTYAKAVVAGKPVEALSPEEGRALRAARLGRGAVSVRAETGGAAPVPPAAPGRGGDRGGAHEPVAPAE